MDTLSVVCYLVFSLSMNTQELTLICQKFINANTDPKNIDFDTIQHFYTQLVDCITDHNHHYYIEANPSISDKEYDELFSYLQKIEDAHPELISENSPSQQLIGQISEWFEKATHTAPLLSLENSYNAKDLIDYDEFIQKRTPGISYIMQPKFDGISVEVIYKDWFFHQAITRWDGKTGENITQNVKTIKNLPKKLKSKSKKDIPSFLSVRWEIMMPKSIWQEINTQREEQWLSPFANTRNAAAGSIKLLDSSIVKDRGLVCYLYDIIKSNHTFTSASEQETYLKDLWLAVFDRHQNKDNIQDIISICENEKTLEWFLKEDIDFDGLVIKVNEINEREELGMTEHHPRRAIAYKFPAQQIATQIESVDYQIWRTGIVTPVGNLTPVQLSWVTISRVSLHNFDFTKEKDLHIGDRVWIQRSGEVIPHVVSVIRDKRKDVQEISPPELCPVCEQKVAHIDWHNYCINENCPSILKWRLDYFASKQCMNIDWLGSAIIEILVDQKIIARLPDLYILQDHEVQSNLKRIPGFWEKKVSRISSELEKSKSATLRRFLNSLGLNWVGKKIAQTIEAKIQSHLEEKDITEINYAWLKDILTDAELMSSIDWIGEVIVNWLQEYFTKEINLSDREKFESAWVTINLGTKKTTWPLSWQSFSLTWSFPISRDNLVELFESQGANFTSSPTKKSNFMLIWEKPGSKKAKAEKMNIQIIEWRDTVQKKFPFLSIIAANNKQPEQAGLFG